MASFYTDHNVDLELAALLRAAGYEAWTTRDLARETAKDGAQLLLAAERGWTLVTQNRKDFELLHDAWRVWTAAWAVASQHAGILVLPQPRPADECMALLSALLDADPPLMNELHLWRPATGWQRRA